MIEVSIKSSKLVDHWNCEQGAGVDQEGNSTRGWMIGSDHLDGSILFNSMDEMKEKLEREIIDYIERSLYWDFKADDLVVGIDDGRVDFTTIEDGEGDILTVMEQDQFQADKKEMYICDYSLHLSIKAVYEPNCEELRSLFPNAEHY